MTDIAALEGFLRDFPDSVYAPHAWFALGQMYPKAGQPEKAIEAFKRAVAHKHGGGIAEDAAFRVAEMLYEVPGDKRFESLPWYEKVVKQWPHGAWFDDASAKVDKMTRDSANVPFPNDRRLDKRIAYRFERETPYPEVFREISILGGVPLRVDASVQWKVFAGSAKAQSIREFMLGTKGTDVLWVSEPDGGYRLVPRAIPDVPAMK